MSRPLPDGHAAPQSPACQVSAHLYHFGEPMTSTSIGGVGESTMEK
jgi:hypothetical protein